MNRHETSPDFWTLANLNPNFLRQCFAAPKFNAAISGKPLQVNSVTYAEGLGMQAPAYFFLNLHKSARQITGKVGIDDASPHGSGSFRLSGFKNGHPVVLFDSQVIYYGEAAKAFSADLTDIEFLSFDFHDNNSSSPAHVDLLEVKISYENQAPETVPANVQLATKHANWFIGARPGKPLTQLGFGQLSFPGADDVALVTYPHRASANFAVDETLRIIQPDGSHSVALTFKDLDIVFDSANICRYIFHLADPVYPITVDWVVKTYINEDMFVAHLEITNSSAQPFTLLNRDSAFIALPADSPAWVSSFSGGWGDELANLHEELLPHGILRHQNRGAVRNPWPDWPGTIVSFNHPAKENEGEAFAAALAWTGSWQHKFTRLSGGRLMPEKLYFSAGALEEPIQVAANSTYATPELLFTYTPDGGKGQLSRNFHHYAWLGGIYNGQSERRVMLNSWEGVYMKFDEAKIISMMDGAADLGVEMYVLDDGWFGNGKFQRNDDFAGLGDWQINSAKLPGGLAGLIAAAEKRGMEFGLWVEPEMVNPNSKLFEQHPDWAMQTPNRTRLQARNQYLLDLSNPAVEEFVYKSVADILSEYPKIHYIKWDFNCSAYNLGSAQLGNNQGALSELQNQAYYRIMARLRHNFPLVTFQLCSSGGGRVEFGAMKYHEEFWASDETNGILRIPIQWGYSHFFPANAIASHIGRYGEGDFKLRADVAMTARLGVELSPDAVTEENRATIRQAIKVYKELRPLLHSANLYRGRSPHESPLTELTFVTPDKSAAVLFAFKRNSAAKRENIVLSGLDSNRRYLITEVNPDNEPRLMSGTYSGKELMSIGIPILFPARPSSAVAKLTMIK